MPILRRAALAIPILLLVPATARAQPPEGEPPEVAPAPAEEPPRPIEQPPAPVEQPPAPIEQPPAPVEQPPAPVEQPPAPIEQPPAPAEAPPPTSQAPPTEVEAEAEPPRPIAGYEKGFFIQSPDGDYKLVIAGRIQFRFTYEGVEEEPDAFAFSIPRARIQLKGHAFTPDLMFDIHVDFAKGGIPALKDGVIEYAAIRDVFHLQAGQFKMPFSRQQINSSTKLDMVDRAPTDKAFGAGRDIGLMIHNDHDSLVEYAVGVFNGYGDSGELEADVVGSADADGNVTGEIEDADLTSVPARLKPRVAARLGYNHDGIEGYDELDIDGGPLRFAIAANGKVQFNADDANEGIIDGGGDFITKFCGATIHGAFYARWAQDGPTFRDQSFAQLGFHAGANYLHDRRIHFGLRYARIVPEGADNDVQEILGGVGVLAYKHNVKAVLDGGPILTDSSAGERFDWRIRSQLQLQL
jgi:hypothetical protein